MLEHLTPRWLCVCELLYQSKSTHGATAGNWSSLWGTMCIWWGHDWELLQINLHCTLYNIVHVHLHHRRPALQVVGFVSTGRNWTSMWGTTQNSLKSICNVQFSIIVHNILCARSSYQLQSWTNGRLFLKSKKKLDLRDSQDNVMSTELNSLK